MYRFSQSFPYLVARLGIRTGDLFTRVARQDGLSLLMYRVLASLAEEGRPLKLGELASRTSADLSTLSRVVAKMHRRGYVARERPENDQRSLQVSLADQGRRLACRYMPVAAHYESVSIHSLSEEQRDQLRAILLQLHDNLDLLERDIEDGTVQKIIQAASLGAPAESTPGKARRAKRKTRPDKSC